MNKSRKVIAILVLALTYAASFTPVYMKYVLYEPLLDAFNITNAQAGYLMAAYTIFNTILYIPGGFIADKYSIKKILSISLIGQSILCFWLSFSTNYTTALVVWLFFGITTGFALWSGLLKAVLSLGSSEDSSMVAGIYGLMGALFTIGMNVLFLQVYNAIGVPQSGMSMIFRICGIIAISASILVWIFYKDGEKVESEEKFELAHLKPLLKNPVVWTISLVILTSYVLRVGGNTYFSPFLLDCYAVDSSTVSMLGILRSNVFPMLMPVAGFVASKVFKSTTKLLRISFVAIGVMFAILTFCSQSLPTWLAIVFSLLPGLLSGMSFGISFAVISESSLPKKVMGTAIGIVSMIVYLPDFVFDPVFGTLIDVFGNVGYTYIFGVLAIFSIVGIVSSTKLINSKDVRAE